MYVGFRGTHTVQVYDANGDFIINIGEGELNMPSDIALDLHGNLYVADSAAHRIRIYNKAGGHLRDIGSFGTKDGEFNFPVSVDVAYATNGTGRAVGELFVADQGNDRFHVFDLYGNLLRVFTVSGVVTVRSLELVSPFPSRRWIQFLPMMPLVTFTAMPRTTV